MLRSQGKHRHGGKVKEMHTKICLRSKVFKEPRYRRAATLPEKYVPEIKEHLQSVGLKWEDFKVTDNSCKPHPPAENPLVAVSLPTCVCHVNQSEIIPPAWLI